MNELKKYADQYKIELLESVVPFWMNHSKDSEFGGYYTCLNRKGEVFDTDKFMWLQGREVWLFSMLYNKVEQKQEWLDMALFGAEFMKKYGTDAQGNWYFSLTREGKPLIQPYNIFSDCFAAMAFSELYKATRNEEHKKIALDTFNNILKRQDNPKGLYTKAFPGTRPLKNFSLPMILCNLSLIMEDLLGSEHVNKTIQPLIKEVMEVIEKKDLLLIYADYIKFMAIVNPEVNNKLYIELRGKVKENNTIQVTSETHFNGIVFYKFKGDFKAK